MRFSWVNFFLILGFFSIATSMFLSHATLAFAQNKDCFLFFPQRVVDGEEITITLQGPSARFLQDEFNGDLFIVGKDVEFVSDPIEISTGLWVNRGNESSITLKPGDENYPRPRIDNNGNPAPATYMISADIEYRDWVLGWRGVGATTISTSCGSDHYNLTVSPSATTDLNSLYPSLPESRIGLGFEVFPDPPKPTDSPAPVDGNTKGVSIEFHGLLPIPSQYMDIYKLCVLVDQEKCVNDGDFVELTNLNSEMNEEGTITLSNVCGDGSGAVKINNLNQPCDSNKDYFHEGIVYRVGLYTANSKAGPIVSANFRTFFTYPAVIIKGVDGSAAFEANSTALWNESGGDLVDPVEISNPVQVEIISQIKIGGDNRNNFQIVLSSPTHGAKRDRCVTLRGEVGSYATVNELLSYGFLMGSSGGDNSPLPVGDYVLEINERINESNWATSGLGKNDCQGGHRYHNIKFSVKPNPTTGVLEAILDPRQAVRDPDGIERNPYSNNFDFKVLPCVEGIDAAGELTDVPDDIVTCTKVKTALGAFSTDPMAFIGDIMKWVIGFASLGALGMLIYSGYLLIYSRGDQEKIKNAKDNIKAVILGFIFILLSVAILQFIGVDILQIPGLE